MERSSAGSITKKIINELRKRGPLWIPFVIMVLAIVIFEVIPAFCIIFNSFHNDSGWSFANYITIFKDKYYSVCLIDSMVVSVIAAIFGLIIGTITAFCLKTVKSEKSEKLITLINITSNFSGVPLAFSYIILLGTSGLITLIIKQKFGIDIYQNNFNLYSWIGITFVYIYFEIPLSIILMFPAVYSIKEDMKEAAYVLGAGKFYFWRKIGIPVLLPSLIGNFTILFANALGAYATAYALVTNSKPVLAIAIANLVSGDIFASPNLASALAVIMGAVLVICMIINKRLTKKYIGGAK